MSSMLDKKEKGMTFSIQKYSVHDGPGIRTIVFLKGCPLSCHWCSNPESQNLKPDLAYNVGRCLGYSKCKNCIEVCTRGAIICNPDDTITIDRNLCKGCTIACAESCASQGLKVYGEERTVDEVLRVVEQDMLFYSRSGGGMTLSGGEALFQGKFAIALLREARRRRIKTAIETCGLVPWDIMNEAAEYINYFLFDIKHMNSEMHKKFTGASNTLILENFSKLTAQYPEKTILCRTPIIPNFNNNEKDIRDICEFIKDMPNVQFEMLAYHRLGTQKYIFMDREPLMGDIQLEKSIMPILQKIAVDILGKERVITVEEKQ